MDGGVIIAIYHLEAKVISRGAGRSACAASAYMSCSRIYNDYGGVKHDYTRKQGLVWEQVFLPPMASMSSLLYMKASLPAPWRSTE